MEDVSVLSIFSCSEYNFYISRISGWREGSQNASMYPSIVGYFTITIVCNRCGLLWMIVISAMIVLYSTMREPKLYSDSGYIRDMWCGTFFSFAPNNLNPEFLFLNFIEAFLNTWCQDLSRLVTSISESIGLLECYSQAWFTFTLTCTESHVLFCWSLQGSCWLLRSP